MSEKPDLWMPLYFGAHLTDTMHLTTEQHGTYFLLLMACWKAGGALPDDDRQLAAIAKLTPGQWRKAKPIIAPFWRISAQGWTQKRLTRELEKFKESSRRVAAFWNSIPAEVRTAMRAKRRASELMAIPAWLTDAHWEEIVVVYSLARELATATGVPHDVDHIVPLQGRGVCGLGRLLQ